MGAPKEPFQIANFTQPAPTAKIFSKEISSRQAKIENKVRNAPSPQGPLVHDASTSAGKPIDVFVVIDDTKDFGIYSGRQYNLRVERSSDNAGYLASLEPVKEKLLNAIPLEGTLKAYLRDFGSTAPGEELPTSAYILDNNKFALNEALKPGKSVHLLYSVKESKDSNCMALSAVPISNSPYSVDYGLPGAESSLQETTYHLQDAAGGKKLFCLNRDLVKPGYQLKVRYTTEKTDKPAQ